MKKFIVIAAVLALFSTHASATVAKVTSKVSRLLHTSDGTFGNCMILLKENPANQGLNCSKWASFSCTGDFTSKDIGYRMFDMSQMAYALDRTVFVYLNDQKKHNGACFVERIDVK